MGLDKTHSRPVFISKIFSVFFAYYVFKEWNKQKQRSEYPRARVGETKPHERRGRRRRRDRPAVYYRGEKYADEYSRRKFHYPRAENVTRFADTLNRAPHYDEKPENEIKREIDVNENVSEFNRFGGDFLRAHKDILIRSADG